MKSMINLKHLLSQFDDTTTCIAPIGPGRSAAARVFGDQQAALQDRYLVQRRHNASAHGAEGAGEGMHLGTTYLAGEVASYHLSSGLETI